MIREKPLAGLGVALQKPCFVIGDLRPGSRSLDEPQRRDREAGTSEHDPDQPLHESEFECGQIGFRRQRVHVDVRGIVLGRTAFVMVSA